MKQKNYKIGHLKIILDRWGKNHGHGWLGRFGGGWRWKLGLDIGGTTIILNLIWGTVRISWEKKKEKNDEDN